MEIIPHDFSGKTIRIIKDEEDNPWWVAKEVCQILGIANPTVAVASLEDDERAKLNLGRQGEANIINEPGLYRLLSRSKKKRAKKFQRWIFHHVLPQLRKTGSYNPIPSGQKTISFIQSEAEAAIRLANTFCFSGNQALLSANKAMKSTYNIDCLELLGTVHLIADDNEIHLTPTQIAKELGNTTARKLNKMLEIKGFQRPIQDTNGKIKGWEPTIDGMQMAVMKDTGKKHSNGTPVQQLFWKKSILKHLES